MAVLNQTIEMALDHYAEATATAFEADVFSYVGGINPSYLTEFRAYMEALANENKADNLAFIIYTPGGVAETVEQMVSIIRHHYKEVWFVVPDMAMSAGTILCMSGDKIYMDYSSALGPIDPQVQNSEGNLVPALGYLDQVQRLIDKAKSNELTDAEFVILQNQDLATLRRYEQARDLSISLLKDWLVKYKFKDWDVDNQKKVERATEIAEALSDHNKWHSHSRMIGINRLTELKLKIEDYTENNELKSVIRQYSDLLLDCVQSRNMSNMFHFGKYNRE